MGISDVKLEAPKNFNAKKIAEKKVMGVRVIGASDRKKIYEGNDGITDAKGDVQAAQEQIDDAAYKLDDGEDEGVVTEDKADDAEDCNSTDPATRATQITESAGNTDMKALENIELFEKSLEDMAASKEAFSANQENSMATITASSDELDEILADNETLQKEMAKQNSSESTSGGASGASFDGTGSGTSSAYSLTTAGELFQAAQNPQKSQGIKKDTFNNNSSVSSTPSFSKEGTSGKGDVSQRFKDNAARANELNELLTRNIDDFVSNSEKVNVSVEEQIGSSNETVAATTAENTGLDNAMETLTEIHTVGSLTETVGKDAKAVGIGLQTTATALNGGASILASTGSGIVALGSSITGIGAPLVSLFGAGTPIVAGGSTTIGAGTSEVGAATSMSGTAGTLNATGKVSKEIGDVTLNVGRGIKIGAEAGITGVNIAQGNTLAAITGGLSFVADAASFAGDLGSATGSMSESTKKVLEKTDKITQITQSSIGAGVAVSNGDVTGALMNGIQAAGTTTNLAGKGQLSKGFNFAGASLQFGSSVANGDISGAVTSAAEMYNNRDVVTNNGKNAIGKLMNSVKTPKIIGKIKDNSTVNNVLDGVRVASSAYGMVEEGKSQVAQFKEAKNMKLFGGEGLTSSSMYTNDSPLDDAEQTENVSKLTQEQVNADVASMTSDLINNLKNKNKF